MVVAKSREELEKQYESVIEEEDFYWVKTEKGYTKILKPRTLEQIQEILRLTGFPDRYIELLPKLRETKALAIARLSTKGLLLWGPAGTGKTTACVWKIAKLLQNHKINNPLYISAFDFEYEKVKALKPQSDCFLIDDLNTGAMHQARLNTLIEVIYHAHAQRKLLFITTNERDMSLPEPVKSRILEMCEVKKIEGKDLRVEAVK